MAGVLFAVRFSPEEFHPQGTRRPRSISNSRTS